MARPRPNLPTLLTRAQSALALNSSIETIDELIRTGRLPACRLGPRSTRIYLRDLEALLVPVEPRRAAAEPEEVA